MIQVFQIFQIYSLPVCLAVPSDSKMPLYIVMGIAIVLMTLGIIRRTSGRSALKSNEADRRIPSLRDHIEVKENLQKLLIDLQDLARQINAHIDTRFCKLEVLLKEADRTIKKLEDLGLASKSQSPTAQESPLDRQEKVDPEREMIYKLADAGKSCVEIARDLNKNTGEIELILSLRRTGRPNKIDYRIG